MMTPLFHLTCPAPSRWCKWFHRRFWVASGWAAHWRGPTAEPSRTLCLRCSHCWPEEAR